jgi:CDP-diacylglycerol--glycerol-3-phosphate 3-phosphatidyltransferase
VNLPNCITLARLVVSGGCFLCIGLIADEDRQDPIAWLAFALFLLAAVTDFVDGFLARRLHQVTVFGRIADPFTDKILICGTMILLLRFADLRAVMPDWVVVVVVARELLVTAIRGLAEALGRAFPADGLGKWKMVAQCVCVSALLTMLAGSSVFEEVAHLAVWIALALTALSGVNYAWKARALLA